MHLAGWPEVKKPKSIGGLDLVPIKLRNEALLCKWGWRFSKEVHALWIKVLKAKYGTLNANGWNLGDEVEKSGSHVLKAWWRISQGRSEVGNQFREHLRLLVGKGNRTFFWEDVWLGDRPLKASFPRLYKASRCRLASVKDVFFVHNRRVSWNLDFSKD